MPLWHVIGRPLLYGNLRLNSIFKKSNKDSSSETAVSASWIEKKYFFYISFNITVQLINKSLQYTSLFTQGFYSKTFNVFDTYRVILRMRMYMVGSKSFRSDIKKPRQMENAARYI